MREMVFKMERPGLVSEGDVLPVTENKVSVYYYYTLGRAYAMSANYSKVQRLKSREGTVTNVETTAAGYYVTVAFDEDEISTDK